MIWIAGVVGVGAVVVASRVFLKRRYFEMYGADGPEFKDPPIAPDLGWPGGR